MYDLIIIGAGPAGLSAAIYAIRKKIRTLVLTKALGGQITEAHLVENYLGIPGISGTDLTEKFRSHIKEFDAEIKEGAEIVKISQTANKPFEIETNLGNFQAKAIIVTSGKKYRELDVPGAKEFKGRGITYCAICDAPLFKNKIAAVVGAGDAGQDTAWELTKYASQIYLLNKYPELRGHNRQMQDNLRNHPKVVILNNCEPAEIKGEKFVKSLVFKCNAGQPAEETREQAIDGIFVEIGSEPASKFLNGMVNLNEKEEIIVNAKTNATSKEGIFAAGDVTDIPYKQLIVAAGEGAKAALSVYEYLKSK